MKDYCVYCMRPSDEDICPHCGKSSSSYHTEVHQLQPGTILNGKYLIGSVLGEGGFGITYVGRDITLDMKIAVKEYFPNGIVNRNNTHSTELTRNSGQMGEHFDKGKISFLTEARTLAKFASEQHCVAVRDFFEQNNTAYIVMEYLEGSDLKDYLSNHGKLTFEEVCSMLIPVMKVLGKVHAQGLIHRDISPANIMILSSGTAKLLDFGAARNVSTEGEKSLSILLKPGYAPEEQYRTKGKQGPWTDVYALSATIYKLLTEITPEDSMNRVFEDSVEPISKYNPSVTPEQETVVMKGMAVKMDDRYQNMSEMIEAYQSCLSPSVPAAAPETTLPSKKEKPQKAESDTLGKVKKGLKTFFIVILVILTLFAIMIVVGIIMDNSSKGSETGSSNSSDSLGSSDSSDSSDSSGSSDSSNSSNSSSINNSSNVTLSGEKVSVEQLEKLLDNKRLKTLKLENCSLTDAHLDVIAQLETLSDLNISGNPDVTDISALNGLPDLKFLYVNDMPQLDFTKLTNKSIEYLFCMGCELKDLSFCSALTEKLHTIDASRNQITDISTLAELTNIERMQIYLSENQISDISALSGTEGPKRLDISKNKITDISPMTGHSEIIELNVSDNQITDISALTDCFNITTLDISYNYIESIKAVEGIADLIYFDFHHNRITSVASLNTLENLKTPEYGAVDATYNNLTSTEGLEAFWKNSSPTDVYLAHNKLADISSLAGCDSLVYFAAADNCLTNDSLNTIITLSGLRALDLEDNQITSFDILLDKNAKGYDFYPGSIYMRMSYIPDIDYKMLNEKFGALSVYNADSERTEDMLDDLRIYGGTSTERYDETEPGRSEWLEKLEGEKIIDNSDKSTGEIDSEPVHVEVEEPELEN